MKSLILSLIFVITGAYASEDNDPHPECPYVLEEGKKKQEIRIIRESAKHEVATIPEPEQMVMVMVGLLMFYFKRGKL